MGPWRQNQTLTVPAGGSAVFILSPSRPTALGKLTIWVTRPNDAPLAAVLTLTPRLNTVPLSAPVVVPALSAVGSLVYAADNKLFTDNIMNLDVLVSNADAVPITVTMIALGVEYA